MKFIEYAALSNKLEKEGSSINEFVKEVTGQPLNEADEKEIETSRAGKGFHSPKFVLKRKKLNNLANQFLKAGKEKVIAKYAPKILGSTSNLITKAAALAQEGKNPKEINNLLAKEAEKGKEIQDKSLARLDTIIDKYSVSFNKRAKDLMTKGMAEKSQGQLDRYWALLELQVRQALDKALVKYREEMIEKAVGNNEEMAKMIELMIKSPNWNQKQQELQDSIAQQKKDYENARKTAENKKKTSDFKAGEVYQYTNAKGESTNLTITNVDEKEDKVWGTTKTKKEPFVIAKDNVGKKLKEAPTESETSGEESEA